MASAAHDYFSLLWLFLAVGTGMLSLMMFAVASQVLRTGRGSPNAITTAHTIRINAGIVVALTIVLMLKAFGAT